MNRFAKKQWDDTEIPRDIRLKARRRAWSRLQPRRPSKLPVWAAAAALAGALAFLLLKTAPPQPPAIDATPLPLAARPEPPLSAPPPPAKLAEVPHQTRARVQTAVTAPPADESVRAPRPAAVDAQAPVQPKRLVLNFRLPETGVRVIWVKESNFLKETGGTE